MTCRTRTQPYRRFFYRGRNSSLRAHTARRFPFHPDALHRPCSRKPVPEPNPMALPEGKRPQSVAHFRRCGSPLRVRTPQASIWTENRAAQVQTTGRVAGALYPKHSGKIKNKPQKENSSTYKTLRLRVKQQNLPKIIDSTCSNFQNLRLLLDVTPLHSIF